MSEIAASIMNQVRTYANEKIKEIAYDYYNQIIYELKLHQTEVAWQKSRGLDYTELNIADAENACRIVETQKEDGTCGYSISFAIEYLNLLDSDQQSVLWLATANAKSLMSAGS